MKKTFSVSDISEWIGARPANTEWVQAESVADRERLTTLKEAGPHDLAFFFSKHFESELRITRAGVIVTGTAFVGPLQAAGLPQWKTSLFLACDDPYGAMAILSGKFSQVQSAHDHQVPLTQTQVHPSAVIDPSVQLGAGVFIGAGAVIERGTVVGAGAVIYPHCYVGPHCTIGEQSVLFHRVTLYERSVLGARVRLHAGAVIGADGFGYAPIVDPTTKKPVGHRKIYHLGRVVLEDDVEVGANSTIDRGTMGDTIVRRQAKIDNMVQVGHNCEIGEGSILCGAAGMAGSSSLGKFVTVAAQSGTGNQVHVGDYSVLRPYTGVAKDVPPDSDLAGVPARPMKEYFKISALMSKMLREREKS